MINFYPVSFNSCYKQSVMPPARKLQSCDTVSFKGHTGIEEYGKNGIPKLIHQTMFFRDYQTKKFAVDYIKKHFGKKDKINIVVGACSTGEESATLAMMLGSLEGKTHILGIDLGKKAISQAKNKKFIIQHAEFSDLLMMGIMDKYEDWYLGFNTDCYPLDNDEKQQKKLFGEFFSQTKEIPSEIHLMDHFGIYESKYAKNYKSKVFECRKGKMRNCEFKTGNILNLTGILKGKKSDVIFFSNALYHMTTDYLDRDEKPDSEKIMDKLAKVLRNNLNTNGLVCFGEREHSQGVDTRKLKEIMIKNGFEPVKVPKKNDTMLPDSIFYKDEKNFTENVFRKVPLLKNLKIA